VLLRQKEIHYGRTGVADVKETGGAGGKSDSHHFLLIDMKNTC
jgi:hypothetical protein